MHKISFMMRWFFCVLVFLQSSCLRQKIKFHDQTNWEPIREKTVNNIVSGRCSLICDEKDFLDNFNPHLVPELCLKQCNICFEVYGGLKGKIKDQVISVNVKNLKDEEIKKAEAEAEKKIVTVDDELIRNCIWSINSAVKKLDTQEKIYSEIKRIEEELKKTPDDVNLKNELASYYDLLTIKEKNDRSSQGDENP